MAPESRKGLGWFNDLPNVIRSITHPGLLTIGILLKTVIVLCKKKTDHYRCLDIMTLLLCLMPPVCLLFLSQMAPILSSTITLLIQDTFWSGDRFTNPTSPPVLFHLPFPSVVDSCKAWLTLNPPSANQDRLLLCLPCILNSIGIVTVGTYYFYTDLIFGHLTKGYLDKGFSFVRT